MGEDCDGFQLVRGRKSRNKCKHHKNLKLPAVDHCDESTDIPEKLPHLMTSIQNYRLELDESIFRQDFEATVSKAGTLASVRTHRTVEESSSKYHRIEKVVAYGVGKYSTCPIARYQFAFLSILCELLKIEKKNCFIYDPRFSSLEREGVLNSGYQLIDINEEGKRQSEVRTLYYMVHCGKALYNNLIWANWNPVHLNNTVIIGNSFSGMSESLPEQEFKTELYCISKAMPLMTEFSIPNTFVHKDIFNNTSLHIFCEADTMHRHTTAEDELLWLMTEEPKYSDCEIITAQSHTTRLLH